MSRGDSPDGEDAEVAALRKRLARREAELEALGRERDELAAFIRRLRGRSDGHTYAVTLGADVDAVLRELARAGGASDAGAARHAVLRAAMLRGLRGMARETSDSARAGAAERAFITLEQELPPSRSAHAAEWRARVDRLTAAIAEARMAFDEDGRPADELVPGVIGEALMRGLETLAFEHGLVGAGGPVFLSAALVPSEERETAESARLAREAALARARNEPDALLRLARAFPTLRGGVPPGLQAWQPSVLDAWAASARRTSAERHAISFVLWVGDPDRARSAPFSLARALREWDRPHRAVFTVWSNAPWWP